MKKASRMRRLRSTRGITLIETVVALGLFAMTAATMSQFLVHQIRAASTNNLYTRAYALAEEQLEATRALRFNDMIGTSKNVTVGGTIYTVATQVDDDQPSNGLKKIKVDVSWKDPQGPKVVTVNTIYTEVRRF